MASSNCLVGLMLGAGVVLGIACTGPYPMTTDTGETESDSGGECPIGSRNCPCTSGGTCDGNLVCASMRCVDISEATTEVDPPTSTSVDPTTTGTGEETTGPECDPNGDGHVDPACPGDAPYCMEGECFDCGGIACESVFPNLPNCDPGTGLCAACLCDDAAPVCDPVSHTCSKCDAHTDCPDSACDLWTGACIAADATLWVDAAAGCDDAAAGTKTAPLCTLGEAFTRVDMASAKAHAIRVSPGEYSVVGPLLVPGGEKVALVHATLGQDDPSVRVAATGSAAISVGAEAGLLLEAIELRDVGNDGIACAGGQLWLDRLAVAQAQGHGLRVDDCELLLRRSVLVGGKLAGALIRTGDAFVENSFFSANGNTTSGKGGGVYLEAGASLTAVYTSFIRNLGTAGTPFAVACDEDPAIEKVDVRNSVAVNKGTNTLCEASVVTNTAWSATVGGVGESNIIVLEADLGAWLTEDPVLTGVFRAIPGTMLDALAMWLDGDPTIDFDGDPRPSDDSSPDFAGADRAAR